MKTCSFENQINLYLDGELSGEKLRSFEAHLQACPQCREEVEQYRGMLASLHDMSDREVPPMLEDRLHAALVNEMAKGDGRVKRKFNPWALTAAAAIVLCLVGGTLLAGSGTLFSLHNSAQLRAPTGDYTGNENQGLMGNSATGSGTDGAAPGAMPPDMAPAATAAATMAAAAATQEAMDDAATAAPSLEDKALQSSNTLTASKSEAVKRATDQLTQQGDGLKLIYTANLVIETRKFSDCQNTIKAMLTKYGGYVENSQSSGVPEGSEDTTGRTATIALRMPIGNYDSAMSDLQALGNVLSKNESTQDVSRQYVDTDARNKTLQLQRQKLYDLLAKADKMENIIALQNEITRLTTEIEQDTAQLKFWDDKVSYSTITVEIHELVTQKTVKPVDPDLKERMNSALYDTINNMKKASEDFAVSFIGFLPWLGIILIVAGVATAIAIPIARKARKAAAREHIDETKKEE